MEKNQIKNPDTLNSKRLTFFFYFFQVSNDTNNNCQHQEKQRTTDCNTKCHVHIFIFLSVHLRIKVLHLSNLLLFYSNCNIRILLKKVFQRKYFLSALTKAMTQLHVLKEFCKIYRTIPVPEAPS